MKKKGILIVLLILFALAVLFYISVNAYACLSAKGNLFSLEEGKEEVKKADAILVLGAGVRKDRTPSHMLEDRLLTAFFLYESGVSEKIIVSGDHGQDVYNEVAAMKTYALEAGVPAEDVFMDHAGFCTYDSVYRAKEIFQADKILIVTQEYHLYRALYIAEKLGVEAYGVASDYHSYAGQTLRDVREIVARCKDFAAVILKVEPKFLGEAIPVSGDGNVTND